MKNYTKADYAAAHAENDAMDAALTQTLSEAAGPTDAEIVEILEATDPVQPEPAAEVTEPEAPVQEPQATETYDTLMAKHDDETVNAMTFLIAAEVDARAAFEKDKTETKTGKDNIQRTLGKVRNQLVTKRAARVMLASGIDPKFMNRSIHEGNRYNVYALGKLADVIYAAADDKACIGNAINNAVMRSLFRMRTAGQVFSADTARCCASDKIKVAELAVRNALVRHTVSESTAPTQASSTMQALETLGIVNRTGGGRNPTYTLSANPIVAKIEEVLARAA